MGFRGEMLTEAGRIVMPVFDLIENYPCFAGFMARYSQRDRHLEPEDHISAEAPVARSQDLVRRMDGALPRRPACCSAAFRAS